MTATGDSADDIRIGTQPECVYAVSFAGRTMELLGPQHPHAFRGERHVEERFEAEGYLPYWRQPWPAAVMLLEFLLRTHRETQEPILEIGAGLGTVAVGLTLCGYRVVATDCDEAALVFAAASAARNRVTLHQVERLDWCAPPAKLYRSIVASDILYHPSFLSQVARFLRSCLAADGTAYVSDMNRRAADAFPDALRRQGLLCEVEGVAAQAIPNPGAIDGRVLKGRVFVARHGKSHPTSHG